VRPLSSNSEIEGGAEQEREVEAATDVVTYDEAVRSRALTGYLKLDPRCLSARDDPEQMPATKHAYDLGAG